MLVNHYPLVREPTDVLWYPEFAQWCGTELTADWHLRFNARVVVYGHLHIPRTTHHDGVRFEEVSIGYPREWKRRGHPRGVIRQVLFDADGHPLRSSALPAEAPSRSRHDAEGRAGWQARHRPLTPMM